MNISQPRKARDCAVLHQLVPGRLHALAMTTPRSKELDEDRLPCCLFLGSAVGCGRQWLN